MFLDIAYAMGPTQPAGQGGGAGSIITSFLPLILISVFVFILYNYLSRQQPKTLGIVLTIIGGAVGIWVFARFTSFAGKFHTWEPPFTEYEITTWIGATIALGLIILGLINLTKSGVFMKPEVSHKVTLYGFCSKCGAKVSSGDAFCSECGHSLK